MKNRTLLSLVVILLLASCAPAPQSPTATDQPATQAAAAAPLVLDRLTAASAGRATQVYPAPGESDNLPAAWVYGWDGLIMMEDAFYFDSDNALHWTSTLPEALDYACNWDGSSDPACQMVAAIPEKAGGPYNLLTVAGKGDLFLGVVDGGKFSLYAGTTIGGQALLSADLPPGSRVLNFRYFPQLNAAALHLRLSDPIKDTLLVVGAVDGSPYEIGFCRTFNASTDPSMTITDLACLLSQDGDYQLGRGDTPEVIETAGGGQVSPLPIDLLAGYPDMNSLLVWPDGKTVGYVNQMVNEIGEIANIDLLKFDLETHELTGSVPLALSPERLNRFRTAYALSPDGSLLAVASLGNDILLIDAASGAVLKELVYNSPTSRLAFSPDGKMLAAGFFNRQIVLVGAPEK